jgi:hypothetical protein
VIRFLADENFDRRITDALVRRSSQISIVLAQQAGSQSGRTRRYWRGAATKGWVVLTHDKRTMPRFARERVARGQAMAGLIVVSKTLPLAAAIEDLRTSAECSGTEEWENVVYLPL